MPRVILVPAGMHPPRLQAGRQRLQIICAGRVFLHLWKRFFGKGEANTPVGSSPWPASLDGVDPAPIDRSGIKQHVVRRWPEDQVGKVITPRPPAWQDGSRQ